MSPSVSVSLSKSPSPSVSVSATPSISASVSVSFSPSISASISKSASPSISVSSTPSVSASISASISASASISLSPSPSPSPGFADYTRGIYDTLPSGILDLTFPYTTEDVIKVSTKNAEYVEQSGTSKYLIHQYKNFVGDQLGCQLELLAQSTQAPSVSRVYLQIFNRDTPAWETIDSDNTTGADTDFILKVDIASLTNYKDASGVIVCRTYQLAV